MTSSVVFGSVISAETLKGMPEYEGKEEITPRDLAQVALNVQTDVEKILPPPPSGPYTFVIIKNATGGELTFVDSHNWSGWPSVLAPPPTTVGNGQWLVFHHLAEHDQAESKGAIVCRGNNGLGDVCDWMAAWDSIWDNQVPGGLPFLKVKADCEIKEQGHFTGKVWDQVSEDLKERDTHEDHWNGCSATAQNQVRPSRQAPIGGLSYALFVATFSIY